MGKLIKLRAKVERLHNEYRNKKGAFYYRKALRTVLFIIDSMKEEPVSEDLEEAGKQYLENSNPDRVHQITNAFKAGAKWQKEQLEKNRLKHCNSITNEQAELEQGFIDQHLDKYNRMPTFLDAIEYGMNLQKEQLQAKAVDVTIAIPYPNGYGGYTQLVDSQEALPFGEKVKVLVIKEE